MFPFFSYLTADEKSDLTKYVFHLSTLSESIWLDLRSVFSEKAVERMTAGGFRGLLLSGDFEETPLRGLGNHRHTSGDEWAAHRNEALNALAADVARLERDLRRARWEPRPRSLDAEIDLHLVASWKAFCEALDWAAEILQDAPFSQPVVIACDAVPTRDPWREYHSAFDRLRKALTTLAELTKPPAGNMPGIDFPKSAPPSESKWIREKFMAGRDPTLPMFRDECPNLAADTDGSNFRSKKSQELKKLVVEWLELESAARRELSYERFTSQPFAENVDQNRFKKIHDKWLSDSANPR